MNFTFLLCRLLLFAILNFNFRYEINNQVDARPYEAFPSIVESSDSIGIQNSVDEQGAIGKEKRRTSIIYLDVTEATKDKKNKTKKKKGKKKKRLKKKNKNRRKNNKDSGSIINKQHEESSSSNGIPRRKATSQSSSDWKEIVPESNMSDSKLSGENNMNRKPVDIIVHIKVKE